MPSSDLEETIGDLLSLDIELHGSAPLLGRASQLAVTINHPVYDCLYLALAADRDAPIATADRRLREAAASAGVGLWEAR